MSVPTPGSVQKATEITKMFGYEGAVEPWTRLIAEQIDLRERPPEPQPIRRGDVVQVKASRQIGIAYVNPDGEITVCVGGGWDRTCEPFKPDDLVRIGRARCYPDGTFVED